MELITDPAPQDLTGVIRLTTEAYEDETSTLQTFLPNLHINDTVARVRDVVATKADAAEVRSFDAEAPIGKAAEKTRGITFDMPPISQKLRVSEADQLRGIADGAMTDKINRRGKQLGEAIADRAELFRGEVLTTGKIHVDGENGVYADVDFGRDESMQPVAEDSWEGADAKHLTMIEQWLEDYSDFNGVEASTMVLSKTALRYLVKSKEIKGAITDTPSKTRITPAMVRGLLTDYGIDQVITYDRQIQVGGRAVRPLPKGRVLFLPSGADMQVGRTVFGTTVEAVDPAYGYGIAPEDAPGIVIGAWRQQDPAGVWVRGNSIAAPVLANPDLAMSVNITGAVDSDEA